MATASKRLGLDGAGLYEIVAQMDKQRQNRPEHLQDGRYKLVSMYLDPEIKQYLPPGKKADRELAMDLHLLLQDKDGIPHSLVQTVDCYFVEIFKTVAAAAAGTEIQVQGNAVVPLQSENTPQETDGFSGNGRLDLHNYLGVYASVHNRNRLLFALGLDGLGHLSPKNSYFVDKVELLDQVNKETGDLERIRVVVNLTAEPESSAGSMQKEQETRFVMFFGNTWFDWEESRRVKAFFDALKESGMKPGEVVPTLIRLSNIGMEDFFEVTSGTREPAFRKGTLYMLDEVRKLGTDKVVVVAHEIDEQEPGNNKIRTAGAKLRPDLELNLPAKHTEGREVNFFIETFPDNFRHNEPHFKTRTQSSVYEHLKMRLEMTSRASGQNVIFTPLENIRSGMLNFYSTAHSSSDTFSGAFVFTQANVMDKESIGHARHFFDKVLGASWTAITLR